MKGNNGKNIRDSHSEEEKNLSLVSRDKGEKRIQEKL